MLVAVPDGGAVGAGGVELHVVDVHLDLGEAAEHVLVAFLRRQRDCATVADVHTYGQWLLFQQAAEQRRLVLRQREQHALQVTLARRHIDRGTDGDDVEGLHGRVGRTQAVRARQPRVCRRRIGRPVTGFAEPRRTGVQVRGERWSPLEMRSQHRERRSARVGVEQDLRSVAQEDIAGSRAEVTGDPLGEVGCLCGRRLRLAEVDGVCRVAVVNGPIPHRGVLVADGDALRWDLRSDPRRQVVLGDHGAVGHRLADQLRRGHCSVLGCPVGQRREAWLQGVEHSPDAPHARRVVLGDVAVEQEVAGSLLHAACAAFDLCVEALPRAGVDRVDAVGLGDLDRGLLQAGVAIAVGRVALGVGAPAVATTMQVIDVEQLGAPVHDAELGRVAEIALRDDRRRVTEHRRRVGVGLLVRLEGQSIHEGLGPVVHPSAAGAVRLGDRVDRRQGQVVLVEDLLLLVADLVQDLHVLSERRGVGRPDHGLPAGLDRRRRIRGRQPHGVGRLDRQHAEQTVVDARPMAGPGAHVVSAFECLVVGNEVAIHGGPAGRHLAAEVLADLVAGAIVRQAVDVQPVAATCGAVGHVDHDTITLVGTDHQWLDRIIAQSQRHLATQLLGTNRGDLTRQGVHLARRVVIAPAVQRDVDVDHRHVVRAGDATRRADTRGRGGVGLRGGDRDDPDGEQTRQCNGTTLARRQRPTCRPGNRAQADHGRTDQQRSGEIDQELRQHRHRQGRNSTMVHGMPEDPGVNRNTQRQRRRHRSRNGTRQPHCLGVPADHHRRRQHCQHHQRHRQGRIAQPVGQERDVARFPRATAPVHRVRPQSHGIRGNDRYRTGTPIHSRIPRVARPAIHFLSLSSCRRTGSV